MRKWIGWLLALCLTPALALAEGARWQDVPELVRPGKAERLTFTAEAAGQAQVLVLQDGEEIVCLNDAMAVKEGLNALHWDGTDSDGDTLPAGAYTLRVTCGDEKDDAPITLGEEAPMILSVMADDMLEGAWHAWMECTMPGEAQLYLDAPAGETLLMTCDVEAGENEILWDGLVEGAPLAGGEWELILRLVDETGFASTAEHLPVEVYVPALATDSVYHTPNEHSEIKCGHDFCFWQMNMGEMDEASIWQVLTQPVTVLRGQQRQQIKIRREPSEDCKDYVAEVTCDSQAVHVLEKGETWSLVEGYSSSESGSSVKVWALPFQGYVKTELLQEKQVDQQYGLVIDKLQQRLYVFQEGRLFTTLLCSTGFPTKEDPFNETPAGEFLMVSWTGGFWSGNLYCDMGMRINGGILVHEVPCQIIDLEDGSQKRDYSRCERYLGEKASHGCVRVQRLKTPEGVNVKWLWDHLNRSQKSATKVIIWDERGRTLAYPDPEVTLYYNPKGGRNYHSAAECAEVNQRYLPLSPFTYGELDDEPFDELTPCPACAPQLRQEAIDEINVKNTR